MIGRFLKPRLESLLKSKSVLLLGPRQVGKSTLIQNLGPALSINLADEGEYLSFLKEPSHLKRVIGARRKSGFIFIDEVQRVPALLNTIQSLLDADKNLRFVLTGSSARKLARGRANLLPGRVIFERLHPLTFWEITESGVDFKLDQALVAGALPEVYLTGYGLDVLRSYTEIYLREEVQAEALTRDLGSYSRFLDIAAELSGQYLNYSKLASDVEINKETTRRFFQILEETLLIHRIAAYTEVSGNRKVRQKDRFVFFDLGVRNAILKKLSSNFTPTEKGPLFEQWIHLQMKALTDYEKKDWRISNYRDDRGLEVDLIIDTGSKLILVEIKYHSKFRPEFDKGLSEFASTIVRKRKVEKIIVYTGERELILESGTRVLPYNEFLHEMRSR